MQTQSIIHYIPLCPLLLLYNLHSIYSNTPSIIIHLTYISYPCTSDPRRFGQKLQKLLGAIQELAYAFLRQFGTHKSNREPSLYVSDFIRVHS